MAVKRGCGFRACGGIYLETKVSRFGTHTVEEFLVDPPIPVDPERLGLSPRGVKLVERPGGGGYDVFDWIGESHYPNVADFVEEVRRYGLSRRVSLRDHLHLLTLDSRLMLVHPRAWIDQWSAVGMLASVEFLGTSKAICPTGRHQPYTDTPCIGLCWHDLVFGKPTLGRVERDAWEAANGRPHREVMRETDSFAYGGWRRTEAVEVSHKPALFVAFPIGQITVIRDPVGHEHVRVQQELDEQGMYRLPIRLEDE